MASTLCVLDNSELSCTLLRDTIALRREGTALLGSRPHERVAVIAARAGALRPWAVVALLDFGALRQVARLRFAGACLALALTGGRRRLSATSICPHALARRGLQATGFTTTRATLAGARRAFTVKGGAQCLLRAVPGCWLLAATGRGNAQSLRTCAALIGCHNGELVVHLGNAIALSRESTALGRACLLHRARIALVGALGWARRPRSIVALLNCRTVWQVAWLLLGYAGVVATLSVNDLRDSLGAALLPICHPVVTIACTGGRPQAAAATATACTLAWTSRALALVNGANGLLRAVL